MMRTGISSNAQAILLLTAPLTVGRSRPSARPLSAAEYRRLARRLRELRRQPADLLASGAHEIMRECGLGPDPGRLEGLLGRGFLLGQAMERWQTRAIWVVSRADADYPRRLKKRLGEDAPPILYGSGNAAILDSGGLAVVGSRNVDDTLLAYTEEVGRLAASAQRTLVSGGARGIDQAAMRGASQAGGRVTGVLADGLEKAVMRSEHRAALMEERLVLVCPYDPAARFHVGHAMQRNKLIYALSDAALVVSSDYGKGGTWTGAVEQLDKLKCVPIHVRADGEANEGIEGLRKRGAMPWPSPKTPKALEEILNATHAVEYGAPRQRVLSPGVREEPSPVEGDGLSESMAPATAPEPRAETGSSPAGELFAKVEELLEGMDLCRTEAEVAEELQVSKKQVEIWLNRFVAEKVTELFAREHAPLTEAEVVEQLRIPKLPTRRCLKRLVEQGTVEKLSRPVRFRSAAAIGPLFDHGD